MGGGGVKSFSCKTQPVRLMLGWGFDNFSGPSSYFFKRNRNYSFNLIPLKGKEYHHIPEFSQNKEFFG